MITQGKWKTHNDIDGSEVVFAETAEGNVTIARIYTGNNPGQRGSGVFPDFEQGEANARLIVAAPDLLEALKEIQDSFANCHLPREVCAFKVAKQAIAKADI